MIFLPFFIAQSLRLLTEELSENVCYSVRSRLSKHFAVREI
jgi:hypothetical protein